uniref:Galanin receptor type 1 n=1 Tax=Nothobranchius rachovii TaxID=451742 RepID=A0A1A8RM26_9TELE
MEQQVDQNQNQLVGSAKPLLGVGLDNLISLLVFGLIFILGVLGNTLVISVMARSKPGQTRSTTNIFILNLSVADLSYLLFCVPFQSTIYMLPTWILGAFICKFIHFFFTVSMLVSIFTLSAMSVDRYVAIVHARKASWIRVGRHAMLGVVLIWILSVGMAAPVAHYQNLVEREDNSSFCWEVWPDRHRRVYVMCSFVFGYLLPLALISVCYMKVLNHLRKKLKNVSKKSEMSKKKTALTVLVVVVVFCLSWLPHHVVHLWVEFGSFPLNQASFVFRMVAHCLAYSNSSVNPVIYAFLSENFRNSYKQAFRCRAPSECPLNETRDLRSRAETANASVGHKGHESQTGQML